ncbi:hypothetical protein OIDMADRAFT_74174, partial [Oidiodendron maius Zn]
LGTAHLIKDDGRIILVPTPSRDPADPLNWSPLRKWTIIVLLVIWSSTALSVQNFLANFLPSVYKRFPDATTNQVNLLLTISTPLVAPGELIFVPLALTYGRRFSLLLSIILLLASTAWGACSTSYGSLLGARILEGFAGGPTDAMGFTIIQEFSFVHERGRMLGVLMMGQLALQLIFAIVTNYMAVSTGFKWPFALFSCISAGTFIGLFIFMPETRYEQRSEQDDIEITLKEHTAIRKELNSTGEFPHFGLKRQMSLWVGKGSGPDRDFFLIFRHMGTMLLHPVIWWSALLNAVITGALIAFTTIYAEMLVAPPWSWPATNVGLVNIGAIAAALVNWILLGWGNDKLIVYLAKRNKGVSAPEHRLLLLSIPIATGLAANVGFGVIAQRYLITDPGGSQPHWFGLAFILAIFYMAFGGILEVTYTYLASMTEPSHSLAAMTTVSVIRDMISFGMSYGVNNFAVKCGYLTSFGVYGMLVAVFGVMGVPVYFYGKVLR